MKWMAWWAAGFIVLNHGDADARWMRRDEAGAILELYRTEYDVKKDGSATQLVESTMFVQGEDGKVAASLFSIDYNSATDDVEVLEAYTLNGKVKVAVEKAMIEDRDKGQAKDYDAMKSRSIAFPQVQIGSRIHIRYKIHTKKAVLRDRWTAQINLGPGGFLDKVQILVRSEVPLYTRVVDPENWATVKQKTPFVVEIKNRKDMPGWTHAEKDPYFHPSRFTRLYISTHRDWLDYMSPLKADVDAVLNAELPSHLEHWVREAKREKSSHKQVLRLMENMSREFRYFGDWRRYNGGVVPRSLAEIERTRFGDCKDLSAVLVKLLRGAGFEADLALVRRGEMDWIEEPNYELPNMGEFNHAIVRAKIGAEVHWLDPTNPVVALQPFSDIAGRPAWILSGRESKFERIPTIAPQQMEHRQEYSYEFSNVGSVRVKAESRLQKMAAFRVLNDLMTQSRSQVLSDLLEYLSEGNEMDSHRFLKEPIAARTLTDTTVALEYVTDRVTYVAGKESFFVIPDGIVNGGFFETEGREADMRLYESPYSFHVARRLKNTELRQALPDPCRVESPWLNLERRVVNDGQDVVIHQTLELKIPYILRAEYKTPAFKKLQKATRECFYRSGVLIGRRGGG